ncbi:MAG: peptide chain release factor-like protein, partial [Planctomycetes bacterium]|nr:peptide chain release factor-like protein [Planctomycetota bacterium]
QRRCVAGRIAVSIAHEDYPTILAEALDAIAVAEFDVPAAARWLGASASQLMKLLRREPSAWKLVSDARRTRGQKPLQ